MTGPDLPRVPYVPAPDGTYAAMIAGVRRRKRQRAGLLGVGALGLAAFVAMTSATVIGSTGQSVDDTLRAASSSPALTEVPGPSEEAPPSPTGTVTPAVTTPPVTSPPAAARSATTSPTPSRAPAPATSPPSDIAPLPVEPFRCERAGRAVDAAGRPLAGVTVVRYQEGHTAPGMEDSDVATTRADGTWTFDEGDGGDKLLLSPYGLADRQTPQTLNVVPTFVGGGHLRADAREVPCGAAATMTVLRPGAVLEGTFHVGPQCAVATPPTDRWSLWVTLPGLAGDTVLAGPVLGADGHFRAVGLPTGEVGLQGMQTATKPFAVTAGATTTHDFYDCASSTGGASPTPAPLLG